jgi:hypothetical protein
MASRRVFVAAVLSAITCGTGKYSGTRGPMKRHYRNPKGFECDFHHEMA